MGWQGNLKLTIKKELIMETIVKGEWSWHNVVKDLARQSGLRGVKIICPNSKGFVYETKEGVKFYIFWKKNDFLQVTMSEKSKAIIEAFAKIVGYRPFCRYINLSRSTTFEWRRGKNNQNDRFRKLKKGLLETYPSYFELRRAK
jgi:hypothetical protein